MATYATREDYLYLCRPRLHAQGPGVVVAMIYIGEPGSGVIWVDVETAIGRQAIGEMTMEDLRAALRTFEALEVQP